MSIQYPFHIHGHFPYCIRTVPIVIGPEEIVHAGFPNYYRTKDLDIVCRYELSTHYYSLVFFVTIYLL